MVILQRPNAPMIKSIEKSSSSPILRGTTAVIILTLFTYICNEAYNISTNLLWRVMGVGLLSVVSYALVSHFIFGVQPLFIKAGLFGKDINKRGTAEGDLAIPESLGLISATIYIAVLCFMHLVGYDDSGDTHMYTIALACVTFMTLLGFADDVLDLKWRHKLWLPLFASLPLLVNYSDQTTVIVPRIIQPVISRFAGLVGGGDVGSASGRLVDLGLGYYIYMALLSIFCTNAINIYAGINGLEAGQVAVIAVFVSIHNALNLRSDLPKDNVDLLRAHHLFSLEMILPLLAVTLGLLTHNWYPSQVFVGDTFCYFAGMTFAMASVLGHYSSTLLLFFVPQVLNFLYSLPQLVGILPCPRHRLPIFSRDTGQLVAVKSHMNLVNLTLWVFGPMTERQLCVLLLVFQVVSCTVGLMGRTAYLQYLS